MEFTWMQALNKGQHVTLCSWRKGEVRRAVRLVRRVTPTGRVSIDTGHSFKPDGREWGAVSAGWVHWLEPFELAHLDQRRWLPMETPPWPPSVL